MSPFYLNLIVTWMPLSVEKNDFIVGHYWQSSSVVIIASSLMLAIYSSPYDLVAPLIFVDFEVFVLIALIELSLLRLLVYFSQLELFAHQLDQSL